ncbi:hypothetical protein KUV51_20190 [Tateyamaria omphalii]|uniref:hypothetical protein n=1 Tax=Tateyamaria omphalii TaxID=299262 RepID=UPI001C992DB1|nr:hypothetical protein [Tateyamaria omphalii]MBY5935338.1 hypothetical protein [Tateyamaria omphalii]
MKVLTTIFAGAAMLGLSACGGGSSYSSTRAVPQNAVLFATGPIYSACRSGGRSQASRARCGCVQAVANQSLTSSEQRRGAGFFSDPQQAQVVRQSDRASDERFWTRWKAYGDSAARQCT